MPTDDWAPINGQVSMMLRLRACPSPFLVDTASPGEWAMFQDFVSCPILSWTLWLPGRKDGMETLAEPLLLWPSG